MNSPFDRVLLVEDEPEIAQTVVELLTDHGYDVVAVRHGEAALNYLRNNPPPRLILLDLMMPVMDGWEFRKHQLRDSALADIPVVIMTAIWGGEAVLPLGAEWVSKPVTLDTLLKLLRRYFQEAPPDESQDQ